METAVVIFQHGGKALHRLYIDKWGHVAVGAAADISAGSQAGGEYGAALQGVSAWAAALAIDSGVANVSSLGFMLFPVWIKIFVDLQQQANCKRWPAYEGFMKFFIEKCDGLMDEFKWTQGGGRPKKAAHEARLQVQQGGGFFMMAGKV